ncbi:MAG: acyl-CoA dehydrogenase family protein [Clostridium sp.]|jgi:alkylation response protein AidB-like acyl-CoA dehydrogenase|nr:acyl-CoA dehydrogenase family protein [Clostridium sp.]
MNFEITKEQRQLKKETMEFARKNLNKPEYYEKFSEELWEKTARFGLLGLVIGEEYGGLGEDYTTAALVFEALGYACHDSGFVFAVNNHIWVCQNLIYLYGSETLRQTYVKRMVSGELKGAIAITEAQAGSDALGMSTAAAKEGDHYIINGSKMFISNGPIADVFVVFAVTEHEPRKKITAFVVEKSFEGLTVGPDIEKMGLGACPTSEIVLENCIVPEENVLGQPGQGDLIMGFALEWERCFEFVPHIGAMRRMMERCVEHVHTRKQFGRELSQYQALTHQIAEMKLAVEMARLMMYKIAWLKDQGQSAFLESSLFKLFVSEHYIKTCRDAMQIFGAYGYTKEYHMERELRDALACSIYSGTNEMQKNTIFQLAF